MTDETAASAPTTDSAAPIRSSDPDAPVFVEVLTDEELSVIARPGPMPVLPFLDELAPAEREVARRSAYRSLVARGIVEPPTPAAVAAAGRSGDSAVDLEVRQDVASVVALREGARLVVAVARTTVTDQDFWYAHLVDDVVLLEEVSRAGFHRFALARESALVAATTAAAVHPDAGDASGEPEPVASEVGDPTPPEAILERLGAAFVRADVVVRRVGDTRPPAFSVLSGPEGCWVVEPADEASATVRAVPLTAAAARARVEDAVSAVRAELGVLHG